MYIQNRNQATLRKRLKGILINYEIDSKNTTDMTIFQTVAMGAALRTLKQECIPFFFNIFYDHYVKGMPFERKNLNQVLPNGEYVTHKQIYSNMQHMIDRMCWIVFPQESIECGLPNYEFVVPKTTKVSLGGKWVKI